MSAKFQKEVIINGQKLLRQFYGGKGGYCVQFGFRIIDLRFMIWGDDTS